MSKITQLFGTAVRARRTSLGFSQEALASKSNSHRNYIGAVERGERNPTLTKAALIARALGVSLSDLLRGI